MKFNFRKNLWWIIASIVLFIPIAIFLYKVYPTIDISYLIFFALTFILAAIVGCIANRIKKIVLKILWLILGLGTYLIYLFLTFFLIALSVPEDIEIRKEAYREMIYQEFSEDEHLDKIVSLELPEYEIVESKCDYASQPPTETEYDVYLKLLLSENLPDSLWDKMYKLASEGAPNLASSADAINKWGFEKNNSPNIQYKSENKSGVGYVVTFKPQCDTVYVECYNM